MTRRKHESGSAKADPAEQDAPTGRYDRPKKSCTRQTAGSSRCPSDRALGAFGRRRLHDGHFVNDGRRCHGGESAPANAAQPSGARTPLTRWARSVIPRRAARVDPHHLERRANSCRHMASLRSIRPRSRRCGVGQRVGLGRGAATATTAGDGRRDQPRRRSPGRAGEDLRSPLRGGLRCLVCVLACCDRVVGLGDGRVAGN